MHGLLTRVAQVCLALTLLNACDYYRNARYSELSEVGERFFATASSGDSSGLAGLTAGDQPITFIKHTREQEPELLAAGATDLSLKTAVPRQDGNVVVGLFALSYAGKTEGVSIHFVRVGETWKVAHVELPSRF